MMKRDGSTVRNAPLGDFDQLLVTLAAVSVAASLTDSEDEAFRKAMLAWVNDWRAQTQGGQPDKRVWM
jgi:hypothetical protein